MWLVEELAICIKPFPVNISNYKYKPMLHGDFGSVFDVWSVEESGDSVGICRIDLYREADALNSLVWFVRNVCQYKFPPVLSFMIEFCLG